MGERIPVKQLTSWSFSRYSDYKQCPLKAKLKHIDKIQEPPNEAMARGAEIHTKAEHYLKGIVKRLPAELKLFKDEFTKLKKLMDRKVLPPIVEDTWALTKDWAITSWNDWTGCWVRIKLDLAHHEDEKTLIVTDWKTGKFRPEMNEDYLEQLELYALGALLVLEHVEIVKPRLIYLDTGDVYPPEGEELVYHRKDLEKLRKTWEKRVKPMMNDKKFAPRPNNKCRWCFYRKSNKANGGGQCSF